MHQLTKQASYRLRFDMEIKDGKRYFAEYSWFKLTGESDKYRISFGSYSGNAGDSMLIHKSMQFSTKDRDNDAYVGNCATTYEGAFWYSGCYTVNINGKYHTSGDDTGHAKGLNWNLISGYLMYVDMKIKRNE